MTNFVSCCSPSAFHIWPEVRIAAGIEASMMTSLGTWKLVMPRSESTIATAGPAAIAASTASFGLGVRAEQAAQAVVGADVGVVVVDVADDRAHGVPEDDRVRDLHHRGLEVDGEQHALLLGLGHLGGEERVERGLAHDRGVEHLALEHRRRLLEHGDRAVLGDVLDAHAAGAVDGHRPLGAAEVAVVHRRDVRAPSPSTTRPSSAGACGRRPSPRPARGGRSCPRAGRG